MLEQCPQREPCWPPVPTELARTYTRHGTANLQCVHLHANGLMVLALLPHHPLRQPDAHIAKVAYTTDRAKNKDLHNLDVRGGKKAGAAHVAPRDVVCQVTDADGRVTELYACVRAKVVQINRRLINEPQLLADPSEEGWIAVMLGGIVFITGMRAVIAVSGVMA